MSAVRVGRQESSAAAYVSHAEHFGVELVFETAAGLGRGAPELPVEQLAELARRLKAIDPKFNPAHPTPIDSQATWPQDAYLQRVGAALAVRAPAPARAGRCCEWCGKVFYGRTNRRTCSAAHRSALSRAGGVGAFSEPNATLVA